MQGVCSFTSSLLSRLSLGKFLSREVGFFVSYLTHTYYLLLQYRVLYAGFTGAIFFAKFRRITQQASIRFSDPLTVRFGSGVDVDVVDDDEDKKPDERRRNQYDKKPLDKLRSVARKVGRPSPFPVITFRIANEMHSECNIVVSFCPISYELCR